MYVYSVFLSAKFLLVLPLILKSKYITPDPYELEKNLETY